MTISRTVYNQLFDHSQPQEKVIRLRPTEAKAGAVVMSAKNKIQMWTKEEHERFLMALEIYPTGPWKKVADYIGTKTPRQTMTHAQKYRQKIHRRQRGLRNQKKNTSAPSSPKMQVNTDVEAKFLPTRSPYGVAEFHQKVEQQQPTGDPNSSRLLDILAHSATAVQMQHPHQTPPQPAVPAQPVYGIPPTSLIRPSPPRENVPPSPDNLNNVSKLSMNSQLPSLAEILHLRGTNSAASGTVPRHSCTCNCTCGAHVNQVTIEEEARQRFSPQRS